MSWLSSTVAFVYDFLADDGWELLAGLVILLPLTYVVSGRFHRGGALLIVIGVLATVAISLGRKVPKPKH